jgi:hypothetical protein
VSSHVAGSSTVICRCFNIEQSRQIRVSSQRLCSHAEPDQILATEDVIEQSATPRSQFSSGGLISPKGFGQSIEVYEVCWRDA